MILVFFVLFLTNNACSYEFSTVDDTKIDLDTCITNVIEKYYEETSAITYVDVISEYNGIIKALSDKAQLLIVTRITDVKLAVFNEGYIIHAKGEFDFVINFAYLRREPNWNPLARFVIIIEYLRHEKLDDIFRELLRLHILDVIVINGTNQADVYTYNIFENNGCGQYFDKIDSLGSCLSSKENFFPNKLVNGFKNCTLRIAVAHMPPFAYHPRKCDLHKNENCIGIEQYVFNLISKLEHFNVHYIYINFAELYSEIDSNMIADGFFTMIQKNETDGLFGYTVLNSVRSQAFANVYSHMAMTDEFIYFVKRVGFVPVWKNIYIEFKTTVWCLIFVSFALSVTLLLALRKTRDKISLVLKMWDSFFLHGLKLKLSFSGNVLLLTWICFASLISSFYQSSLVSLTMNPSKEYQISTVKDLEEHLYKPCVAPAVKEFLGLANMYFYDDIGECETFIESMEGVSNNFGIYGVGGKTAYTYNVPLFTDEEGQVKTYYLAQPLMKVIYSFYFYKGFPLEHQLSYRCMQFHESGLVNRFSRNIIYQRWVNFAKEMKDVFVSRMVVPWAILVIGYVVAFIVFILELFGKYNY